MTYFAGVGVLQDNDYTVKNCEKIMTTREVVVKELYSMNFEVLPSLANFIFCKNEKISGKDLYEKLKDKGVLVRYFSKDRIKDYVRVTIGSAKQMKIFIQKTKEILENLWWEKHKFTEKRQKLI